MYALASLIAGTERVGHLAIVLHLKEREEPFLGFILNLNLIRSSRENRLLHCTRFEKVFCCAKVVLHKFRLISHEGLPLILSPSPLSVQESAFEG